MFISKYVCAKYPLFKNEYSIYNDLFLHDIIICVISGILRLRFIKINLAYSNGMRQIWELKIKISYSIQRLFEGWSSRLILGSDPLEIIYPMLIPLANVQSMSLVCVTRLD